MKAEDFVVPLIFVTLLVGFISLVMCVDSCDEKECLKKNGGKSPFIEETLFATTKDGCEIMKVTKRGSKCKSQGYVYISKNCKGTVSWESPDKPHPIISTTNE